MSAPSQRLRVKRRARPFVQRLNGTRGRGRTDMKVKLPEPVAVIYRAVE
jgi:hypothetical protein